MLVILSPVFASNYSILEKYVWNETMESEINVTKFLNIAQYFFEVIKRLIITIQKF